LAGVEAEVPSGARREVAERMATLDTGAPIAVALWPLLLHAGGLDASGYRAYAEALGRTGRQADAAQFLDFARAATGELPLAPLPSTVSRLFRPRAVLTHSLPSGALPVQSDDMPELHAMLVQALFSLGAPEVFVYLDPQGGPEAWMAGPETLVLGAGGLSHFGPAELTFLLALALLLGEQGVALATPGPLSALAKVAPAAYLAVPSPLAAARVLVLLDASVRGADVEGLDAVQVLAASEAFHAVIQRALALV
jgi:hypothetical protein